MSLKRSRIATSDSDTIAGYFGVWAGLAADQLWRKTMDMSLFTSLEGRINRAKWWLGTVILLIVSVVVYFILAMFTGGSMISGIDPAIMGPDAMA
jgi:hypothetical protein